MTNQISILNTSIRKLNDLYSLNDLHRASGNNPKHRPSLFIRLETTKDLINEISKEVRSTDLIFKTLRGRNIQGTYACEELVLSYAMWISPKFHLVVLRAFLNMHRQPQQLSLPETTQPQPIHWRWQDIRTIAWLWFSHGQMQQHLAKLLPVLETLESSYAARTYSQIHEYCSFYQEATPLIAELLEDCPFDPVNRHHLNRILQELKSLKSETKLKALQQLKGF